MATPPPPAASTSSGRAAPPGPQAKEMRTGDQVGTERLFLGGIVRPPFAGSPGGGTLPFRKRPGRAAPPGPQAKEMRTWDQVGTERLFLGGIVRPPFAGSPGGGTLPFRKRPGRAAPPGPQAKEMRTWRPSGDGTALLGLNRSPPFRRFPRRWNPTFPPAASPGQPTMDGFGRMKRSGRGNRLGFGLFLETGDRERLDDDEPGPFGIGWDR
jgi:hypothetical protein